MKLLTKTTGTHFVFTTLFLCAAGITLYFLITDMIRQETIEKLLINKQRIVLLLSNEQPVISLPPVIVVEEISEKTVAEVRISDTMIYDREEQDDERFLEISSDEEVNGKIYNITLRQVILEPHDFYHSIGIVLAGVMILLLAGLVFLNRRVFRSIWSPFHENLERLKNFSLQKEQPPSLAPSSIQEFNELNQAADKLFAKMHADYRALKEFTENASHEMQSPLAVIQSQMELLLQSPVVKEEESKCIQSALSSVQRLSKLNQSLLLLARIGNRQFASLENIWIDAAVEKQLAIYNDFILAKEIRVEKNILVKHSLPANPVLFEILLSNLVGNAIKHNLQKGKININANDNGLIVSNSGENIFVDPHKFFDRFSKADATSESSGLGLAIVKSICDAFHWQAAYTHRDGWHAISIVF